MKRIIWIFQRLISIQKYKFRLFRWIYFSGFFIDNHGVLNLLGKLKYLTMTETNRVWMPDTFFRNEKVGRFHNILQPNLYVRVFPNGDVLYSIRVSLTCACSMHLALFPLDKQTCNLDVASCKCKFSASSLRCLHKYSVHYITTFVIYFH